MTSRTNNLNAVAPNLIASWNTSISDELIPQIVFDGRVGFFISQVAAASYAETLEWGGAIKRISKAWRKKHLKDIKDTKGEDVYKYEYDRLHTPVANMVVNLN